ncbi:MAG: hypothetical protein IAE84_18600 [Saprospiraceae bacterium]|nr:hypothetical protein [Saprospiraceae bacterium]HRD80052.1 hypothetical protein [Saprospiraceae bacterium]HRF40986.1 hypothetical protein [Saprospiraceae bacterium]HRK83174.1 hypothetical protein [Saprospiraceae bacterium]
MSKFRFGLGPSASNVVVVLYVFGTLLMRFLLEQQLQGRFVISLAMGAFALLFLWAMIRSKVLNPTLLGLAEKIQ